MMESFGLSQIKRGTNKHVGLMITARTIICVAVLIAFGCFSMCNTLYSQQAVYDLELVQAALAACP